MEKTLTDATLCFVLRGPEVLLARKARYIGEGLWNGYGGGIEEGDASPEEATIRELAEECGVIGTLNDLEKIAIVDFNNTKSDGKKFTCRVHTYLLPIWSGQPRETEEMLEPTWFHRDALPLGEMMLADRYWVPRIFKESPFYAQVWYGPKQQTLLKDVEFSELKKYLRTGI